MLVARENVINRCVFRSPDSDKYDYTGVLTHGSRRLSN